MGSDIRQRKSYASFAAGFSGTLVGPGDDSYDDRRALHNAMVDKRPGLIAQCATPQDVSATIAFARDAGIELAVRAGGHSVAGMSTLDDGIVIDVRPMNDVTVDPKERTARVGAGANWSEFDRAAQEHGLATTGGRVSTTGVAGFTLGGGSGWIERKYGLACDNLRSVELVLADGQHVVASATENPDLFWGLRGGGGNFGVATAFEFDVHPIGPTVYAGLFGWSAASGDDVAHTLRAVSDSAPEELGTGLVSLTGPPEDFIPPHLQGQPAVAVPICWFGDLDDGPDVVAPFRALNPDVDLVGPMPYADFQCMIDDPPGLRNYWSGAYMSGLPDDAIATFLKASADKRSPLTQNLLLPWGGAVARVSAEETPMSNRDTAWIYHPFAVWELADDDQANISWARDAIADMRRFSTGGTYLNFIGDEGTDRIEAAFGPNYSRLRELKRRYDPDNIFHGNQNIRP